MVLLDEVECVGRAGGGGQDEEKGQRKGFFDSEARLGKNALVGGLDTDGLVDELSTGLLKDEVRPLRPTPSNPTAQHLSVSVIWRERTRVRRNIRRGSGERA